MSHPSLHPARLLLVFGFLALAAGAPSVLAGKSTVPADDYEEFVLPLLEKHCTRCHGERIQQGSLDLTAYHDGAAALADPTLWRSIQERVVDGTMPPGAAPGLLGSEREVLVGWIEASFSRAEPASVAATPGRPVLRRLNHTEYRCTIRDLFGVDYPADELFPSDGVGHGFDTSGDALSMPDAMFEKYLDAAEWIAARAIVTEEPGSPPAQRSGPEAFDGAGRLGDDGWLFYSGGGAGFVHEFPREGEYLVRANAWGQQAGPELAKMQLAVGAGPGTEFEVPGERGSPSTHELRLRIPGGRHRVEARFVNDYYDPQNPDPRQRDRNLSVRWLEVVGPLDPPPIGDFQRELFARFGEALGARRLEAIVGYLALRAWRRPVTDRELARLSRLARGEDGLEARVRLALTAILASPSFLFRPEPDRPASEGAAARALDGFELATRLSYFLWSSTPDESLLEAARRGDLADEAKLLAEVDRLLADPRSSALASGFAAQWLQVRVLERAAVDEELFPGFDDALRESMRAETLLFFDALLHEKLSVWALIDGDFTFVDERLAAHYGIEGVSGEAMQRVSLDGLPRRGVLTHASVLTLTSNPNRTSPVKRGKWIMETLLGTPPPPPPPGVEALDESPEAITSGSVRERFERHRADPACAACHVTMDPLGFSLENYDAVGAWRVKDGAFPIDASGVLPDGREFEGPLGLVGVLRAEEGFVRTLFEKLLVYALGRGLTESDDATIVELLAELDPEEPTLRAMIEGIVRSSAFRERSQEIER